MTRRKEQSQEHKAYLLALEEAGVRRARAYDNYIEAAATVRELLRDAAGAGVRESHIARALGVSRQRVWELAKEVRDGDAS